MNGVVEAGRFRQSSAISSSRFQNSKWNEIDAVWTTERSGLFLWEKSGLFAPTFLWYFFVLNLNKLAYFTERYFAILQREILRF